MLDYAIRPGDAVFFMFNPFVEETLDLFLDKLETSCRQFPRKTFFPQCKPAHLGALEKTLQNIPQIYIEPERSILGKE